MSTYNDRTVDKRYGLIGYPLSHSFSPTYWARKWDAEGVTDHTYDAIPLEDVSTMRQLIEDRRLSGINVTIPHKKAVLPYLDQIAPEAIAIGAVNCIKNVGGQLTGHNTDAYGFEQSLLDLLDGAKVEKALVLGSGGAAAAIKYVLGKLDILCTTVSRKPSYLQYGDINDQIIEAHKLIINTTPLGMYPLVDTSPSLPFDSLSPDHYCYDLVYNPEKTLFLRRSEERGAAIKNGHSMLILQADRSWQIWNE